MSVLREHRALRIPSIGGLYYDLAVQWLALAAEVDARVSGPVAPGPD